jgi:UDP-N-acetylglucosamine--N-acetylmuramyl-(pentapeptide) pyrophosphoryl-undecaprenol N-acetylglucosamine transferase
MEGDIISRQNIPFQAIPAAGIHGVGFRNLPRNISRLVQGYLKAGKLIREFKPDVMFFTGGYLAVPVAFAGRSKPSLVYIPDIEPGLAIRTITQLTSLIAVTIQKSTLLVPRRKSTFVRGYPVRNDILSWTKEGALDALELDSALPVLLVFGGSKGARSINRALVSILPELLEEMQVVHITGKLDWEEIELNYQNLSDSQKKRYRVYPFLHQEMGAALRAADLVVSRSGASILGEYPMFGLPAILVPYPHAWRYQKTNAEHLVTKNAAVIIDDDELEQQLLPKIQDIIHDPDTLFSMREAMKDLAQPKAAERIARKLFDLAGFDLGGESR